MTEREELVSLRAEKRQLADYALELEEEVARLKGIIAERERGGSRQYRETIPAQHLSTWNL